jgi:hypothetical protein
MRKTKKNGKRNTLAKIRRKLYSKRKGRGIEASKIIPSKIPISRVEVLRLRRERKTLKRETRAAEKAIATQTAQEDAIINRFLTDTEAVSARAVRDAAREELEKAEAEAAAREAAAAAEAARARAAKVVGTAMKARVAVVRSKTLAAEIERLFQIGVDIWRHYSINRQYEQASRRGELTHGMSEHKIRSDEMVAKMEIEMEASIVNALLEDTTAMAGALKAISSKESQAKSGIVRMCNQMIGRIVVIETAISRLSIDRGLLGSADFREWLAKITKNATLKATPIIIEKIGAKIGTKVIAMVETATNIATAVVTKSLGNDVFVAMVNAMVSTISKELTTN